MVGNIAGAVVKTPEIAGKKRGCCLGGCLGIVFWLGLSFASGWYVCELEHNAWNVTATNTAAWDRSTTHLSEFKQWAESLISGGADKKELGTQAPLGNDSAKAIGALVARGEESLGKARVLLQQAGQATGTEQARLVRVALKELQNSYENYTKAAQMDPDNQKLLQMRVQVNRLMEQLQRR